MTSWLFLVVWALALALAPTETHSETVVATVETSPVPSSGDAADDPAIWVHPSDSSLSVIIGTDKQVGIAVYDLAGDELQFRSDGALNNVDVRYGFPLGGGFVDIAAASNRTDNTISIYEITSSTRTLAPIAASGGIQTGIAVYGFCLYASLSGSYYAYVNSKAGEVEQWELFDNGAGLVAGVLVRSFDVGGKTEGCVGDDRLGAFYIGEEDVAIWRYGAEPQDGDTRIQVDSTGSVGNLSADVEGLTIFYRGSQTGYLIASSQGDDSFAIYDRGAGNAYIGSYSIVDGALDGVNDTDGIDVISVSLGPNFPWGVFVAQDGNNSGANQNYKLVPWDDVALAFDPPLEFISNWNPRTSVPVPALTPLSGTLLTLVLLMAGLLQARQRPIGSTLRVPLRPRRRGAGYQVPRPGGERAPSRAKMRPSLPAT